MSKVTQHRYTEAINAFADDLDKLDSATAHAVVAEAQKMIHKAWLRQEIQKGRDSGEPLDGETVMAELLAEADADIIAASK